MNDDFDRRLECAERVRQWWPEFDPAQTIFAAHKLWEWASGRQPLPEPQAGGGSLMPASILRKV